MLWAETPASPVSTGCTSPTFPLQKMLACASRQRMLMLSEFARGSWTPDAALPAKSNQGLLVRTQAACAPRCPNLPEATQRPWTPWQSWWAPRTPASPARATATRPSPPATPRCRRGTQTAAAAWRPQAAQASPTPSASLTPICTYPWAPTPPIAAWTCSSTCSSSTTSSSSSSCSNATQGLRADRPRMRCAAARA